MTAPTKGNRRQKAEESVQLRATISREKLTEALTRVAPAVARQATLPVLTNVLIEATERGLQFTATDLDLTIRTTIVADVEQVGALTLPLKRLLAIAKELPPAPVRLSTQGVAFGMIDCGRAHYKLLSQPVEHFPSAPAVAFEGESVSASELGSVVRRVSFAVSDEESRPILNGVLWQRSQDTTRLVATNGHRMAVIERKVDPTLGRNGEYIVPRKAIEQVARLFGDDEELAIGFSGSHLSLRSDFTTIVTRLIEGPYPNYRNVIPVSNSRVVIADRLALIHAVKRCMPVLSTQTYRLRVDLARSMVRVSGDTVDVGECSDEIAARIMGENLSFGVNASYLLELLNAIDTDEVKIQADAPERAIILEPEGEQADQKSLFLLMPLRLLD